LHCSLAGCHIAITYFSSDAILTDAKTHSICNGLQNIRNPTRYTFSEMRTPGHQRLSHGCENASNVRRVNHCKSACRFLIFARHGVCY
jgi:hypothetical protein